MTDSCTGADLFGDPGTTELPIMNALSKSDVEYVLGLQEDIATSMAAGYASTCRYHAVAPDICPAGVADLYVTPELAHGTGNILSADFGGAPVIATAGNHEFDVRHEEPILNSDLEVLADQFYKYSVGVTYIDALPVLIRRVFRVALTPPTGPVFPALPADVMQTETDASPEPLGHIADAGSGDPAQIEAAADYFVEADQPVLVLGDHVARAGKDAVDAACLAEAAGAHPRQDPRERSELPDRPRPVDLLISSDEGIASMLMDTDTLGLVGCSANATLMHHEEPLVSEDAMTIQVSSDPREVGKNVPANAAAIGDPGRIMARASLSHRSSGRSLSTPIPPCIWIISSSTSHSFSVATHFASEDR